MIRGLIFDFDGLILDTETPEFQSWQEIFQEHGAELRLENWSAGVGKGSAQVTFSPYDDLERQIGHAVDRDALRQKRRPRYLELIAAQPVLPGVEDCLAAARRLGLQLGLASSSSREWVGGHLSRLGLDAHFACLRCADDVENTKPHPELYLAALEALGLRAEEAIALEDSPHGIAAAKAAGLFCIAIPNSLTRRLMLDHADLRLNSLADLPLTELIAKVEGRV